MISFCIATLIIFEWSLSCILVSAGRLHVQQDVHQSVADLLRRRLCRLSAAGHPGSDAHVRTATVQFHHPLRHLSDLVRSAQQPRYVRYEILSPAEQCFLWASAVNLVTWCYWRVLYSRTAHNNITPYHNNTLHTVCKTLVQWWVSDTTTTR